MYNICIFAGTTEGRRLAEALCTHPVRVTVSVATDYAGTLIAPHKNLNVLSGRLECGEIAELFLRSRFDLIIDATHPYANIVTKNVKRAAKEAKTEYIRLVRGESKAADDAVFVKDTAQAAEYLNETSGNILFTTGAKELCAFSWIKDFKTRAYARVIPLAASLSSCEAAGLAPSHIIAMQGPFSEEMNAALINTVSASYVVTKDGGDAGGFPEKAAAAKRTGARLIVIGRPAESGGLTYAETLALLRARFAISIRPRVYIVGMGMGNEGTLTADAKRAVESADCIIGSGRMLSALPKSNKPAFEAVSADEIAAFITAHEEYASFAALMSGDTGFYSGAKRLSAELSDCEMKLIPGISTLSYLCAALKMPYDDIECLSLHGRDTGIVSKVKKTPRLFVLLGGENTMEKLCAALCAAGLGDARLSVGERLGYPDEKITRGTARELSGAHFDALCAAIVENERADECVSYGLNDEEFLRGDRIPMTKSEVRALCLSKLRLTKRSVLWDIGAGTGSVSLEAARLVSLGHVYAVEIKDEAAELIKKNKERHAAGNLTVVSGMAPEVCEGLPAPTHVFIGGSLGRIRDIIELSLRKNPDVSITATAVSLETVSELSAIIKEFGFSYSEAVCVNVSRAKTAGAHTLMAAENPVYIFTMNKKGEPQ
ncbi:MAG: precorrin-6A reductase [Clostridia bacterium]|nr:precorrin-6A reductase [Clostridia bacterium]